MVLLMMDHVAGEGGGQDDGGHDDADDVMLNDD